MCRLAMQLCIRCLCVVPVISEAGSRARSVNSEAGRYVYVYFL